MRARRIGIVTMAALAVLAPDGATDGVKGKLEVLTSHPLLPGVEGLVLSADGRHFAYTSAKDGKKVFVRDGTLGEAWDTVQAIALSPDGSRWAHWGERDGKLHLVLDGKAIPVDGRPHFVDGKSLWFGPAGRHAVAHLSRGGRYLALVDGTPGLDADVAFGVRVSPDGSRTAYSVARDGKAVVVLDGKVQATTFDGVGEVVFSADGKRHGYPGSRGEEAHAVIDGKEGPAFDQVEGLALSAERAAYRARRKDGRWVAVVDGEAGPDYHLVAELVVAGPHVAYVARKSFRTSDDQTWVVVRDGKEGREAARVRANSLRLSPDGARLAYVTRKGQKWQAVVDGTDGEEFDAVLGAFLFSPDGKRFAYAGRRAGKWHLVVDGQASEAFDEVGQVAFSPDGALVVAQVVKGGKPLLRVTSPSASAEVGGFPGGVGPFSFDGPRSVQLLSGPVGILQVFRVTLEETAGG